MAQITVDLRKRQLLFEQIVDNVKEQIMNGTLTTDDYLPSVRSLANELGINPNTIQKAYTELERQEIIRSLPGRGSIIVATAESLRGTKLGALGEKVRELAYEAASCGMDFDEFCRAAKAVFDKEGGDDK